MASHVIKLELAHPRDARALALMSRDLIEAGLGWGYRHETILRFIDEPEVVVLTARVLQQPIGFAVMKFGDDHAHLVLLAVRPSHQRQGIARRIVAWLVESALVAGMTSIRVELRASNRSAHAFYRAIGFFEALRVPGYYQGREAAVRMIRVLTMPTVTEPPWRPPDRDPR